MIVVMIIIALMLWSFVLGYLISDYKHSRYWRNKGKK